MARGNFTKGADQSPKESPKESRKRKNSHLGLKYDVYIHRILKQVNPDRRISSDAMKVVNDSCQDLYGRLKKEIVALSAVGSRGRDNSSHTLAVKDIISAARFVLPGEICKHAVSQAYRAVNNYEVVTNTGSVLKEKKKALQAKNNSKTLATAK